MIDGQWRQKLLECVEFLRRLLFPSECQLRLPSLTGSQLELLVLLPEP